MKKTFLGLMLGIMMLMVAGTATADTTTIQIVNGISGSSVITGTITVGVEVNISGLTSGATDQTSEDNVTNIELLYLTNVGGASTIAHLSNISHADNMTGAGGSLFGVWNFTFDTSGLNDSDSPYTFSARASNGTAGSYNILSTSATLTGVTIDNTVPTVSLDDAANTIFSSSDTSATATVTNIPGTCVWNFGSNSLTGTLDAAKGSCSLTLANTNPADGAYQTTVTVSDGLNSTTSSTVNYQVKFASDGRSSAGQDVAVIIEEAAASAQGGGMFGGAGGNTTLIVLGFGLIVLFVFMNKNGSNGRK